MLRITLLLCIVLSFLRVHSCENLLNRIFDEGYFVVESIDRNINELASVPEIADTIVRDLYTDYGVKFSTDDSDFTLQNELVKFLLSDVAAQDEVLTGFPSEYKVIPRLLRELKAIGKKELAKMNEDDQEVMKEADMFTSYILRIKPMAKLIRQNSARYAKQNLSKAEIKFEIASKRDYLLRKWSSDLLGTIGDNDIFESEEFENWLLKDDEFDEDDDDDEDDELEDYYRDLKNAPPTLHQRPERDADNYHYHREEL